MSRTKTIGGLIGPTLLAIAAALLLNSASVPAFLLQASGEPVLLFVTGVLLFVAGLAIVRIHNVWSGGWPVLVTVIGWLAVFGGLVRMLFPLEFAAVVGQVSSSRVGTSAAAAILLVVAAFLTFKSYARD